MTFEENFNFWLAKKVVYFLEKGYTIEQIKVFFDIIYFDFKECIDDNVLLNEIKEKMVRTIEVFSMGEQK